MPKYVDIGVTPKIGFRVKYGIQKNFLFDPIVNLDDNIIYRQYFLNYIIKPVIKKENCHSYGRIISDELNLYLVLMPKGDQKHYVAKELKEGDILLDVSDPPYYQAYLINKELEGSLCTNDFIILSSINSNIDSITIRYNKLCKYLTDTKKPSLPDIISLKYLYL